MDIDLNSDVTIYEIYGRYRAYVKSKKKVYMLSRLIMSKKLGRSLKSDEEVHHIDGDPLNDNPDNLVVLSRQDHILLHSKLNRKYKDIVKICPICGKEFLWTEDAQKNYRYNRKRRAGKLVTEEIGPFCSRKCAGTYGRSLQLDNMPA